MNPLEITKALAAMKRTSDADDAIATINRLIQEAKAALKDDSPGGKNTRKKIIERARDVTNDELEIDDDPGPLSCGEGGAWVPAWVWVKYA